MSLEQALIDNTAALTALTALMAGATVATVAAPAVAATPAPRAPGRPKKVEAAAVEAPKTRYFLNTKHNTTFKREPTEPQVDLPDSVEITAEAFQAAQSVAASNAAPGEASAETSTTATADADDFFAEPEAPAAKPVIDTKTMTEKLMALHKAPGGGNAALVPILQAVGAKSVPSIKPEDCAKVYELASAKLAELAKAA